MASRTPTSEPARRHGRNKKAAARFIRRRPPRTASAGDQPISYHSAKGVAEYATRIIRATPLQIMQLEREGVLAALLKDIARSMDIPASRLFTILGIPKATAEKKIAAGERVNGQGEIGRAHV